MTDYRHEAGDEAERFVEYMQPDIQILDILSLLAIFSLGIWIYIVVAA